MHTSGLGGYLCALCDDDDAALGAVGLGQRGNGERNIGAGGAGHAVGLCVGTSLALVAKHNVGVVQDISQGLGKCGGDEGGSQVNCVGLAVLSRVLGNCRAMGWDGVGSQAMAATFLVDGTTSTYQPAWRQGRQSGRSLRSRRPWRQTQPSAKGGGAQVCGCEKTTCAREFDSSCDVYLDGLLLQMGDLVSVGSCKVSNQRPLCLVHKHSAGAWHNGTTKRRQASAQSQSRNHHAHMHTCIPVGSDSETM